MTERIRTLIIDDEPLARDALRVLLADHHDIEIVGECRNGRDAIKAIREQSPDLIFLDIQMPDADGFQVLTEIDSQRAPVVIFVTAYDEYALRAFDAHAIDYLLKPFDHERFSDAVQRARQQIRLQELGKLSERLFAALEDLHQHGQSGAWPDRHRETRGQTPQRLAIKVDGRILLLRMDEIDWIEAAGDYMRIHVGNRSYLLRETMSGLVSRLDPEKFLRIHRSTLVNVERIKDIQPLFRGEHAVTLKDGVRLKLSRTYRDRLAKLLNRS